MARPRKNRRSSRRGVLVDAVYLVALLRKHDEHHARANRWRLHLAKENVRLIVTEAVLWEWVNACSGLLLREQAIQGYRHLHEDEQVEVVPFQPKLIEAAVDLYESRPDKSWSLTDCLSFVIMQERKLTDALTADHHFEQAGFRALLLEDPP
jgi:predicted nucleic acid-binding protein